MPDIALTQTVFDAPILTQFGAFIDDHRATIAGCVEGLTEEQARRSLVPSPTTLLGLVKHATFVERVWFGEGVLLLTRAEMGIPATRTSPSPSTRRTPSSPCKRLTSRHVRTRAGRCPG